MLYVLSIIDEDVSSVSKLSTESRKELNSSWALMGLGWAKVKKEKEVFLANEKTASSSVARISGKAKYYIGNI